MRTERIQQDPSDTFPAIAEILEFAGGAEETGNIRFLRTPQLRALETYWCLRLVTQTPHILDLYRRLFTNPSDLLEAMGLAHADMKDVLNSSVDSLHWPQGGQGFPRLKRYLDETEGRSITSVWDDLYAVNSQAGG